MSKSKIVSVNESQSSINVEIGVKSAFKFALGVALANFVFGLVTVGVGLVVLYWLGINLPS